VPRQPVSPLYPVSHTKPARRPARRCRHAALNDLGSDAVAFGFFTASQMLREKFGGGGGKPGGGAPGGAGSPLARGANPFVGPSRSAGGGQNGVGGGSSSPKGSDSSSSSQGSANPRLSA